jgi:hypothetical protein
MRECAIEARTVVKKPQEIRAYFVEGESSTSLSLSLKNRNSMPPGGDTPGKSDCLVK